MLTLPLLLACAPSGGLGASDSPGADSVGAAITWYRDVQPILQQNCVRCHEPGGQGPGDFTNYDLAVAMSELMVSQVHQGVMPPPASDPECRDYVGSESLSLVPGAQDVLQAWIDAGTPLGDPADAVQVDPVDDQLADPDFVVRLAEPYRPSFSTDGNEWRCFVVQGVPEQDYYLSAMQATIDNAAMVHHIVLHSVNQAAVTSAHLQPQGWDCADGSQYALSAAQIGVWAPGMLPVELPDGVGVEMQGGAPLLLEFHYYDPGDLDPGATDQSGYAFRVEDAVETPAYPYVWGPTDLVIPAGEAAYIRSTWASFGSTHDYTLYTMWPHMHVLGDGYDVRVTTPAGDQDCLVTSHGYSFDNQYAYSFVEPYVAVAGSSVDYACVWNNTASNPDQLVDPPETAVYGPRSQDEMCFFYGFYSVAPAEPRALVGDVTAGQVSVVRSPSDLDVQGTLVTALDYGGAGAQVGGIWFEGDLGPGYSYGGPNAPDLDGDAGTWTGLEQVLYTLIYDDPWAPLDLSVPVTAGASYRLQLLFFENYYSAQGSRKLDIAVDDQRVVASMDTHTNSSGGGVLYTLDVAPTTDTLHVQISGAAGGDGYALINGLVLTQLP
jgi:hypothetical protein